MKILVTAAPWGNQAFSENISVISKGEPVSQRNLARHKKGNSWGQVTGVKNEEQFGRILRMGWMMKVT